MADIHDRAVIATVGTAIDQKVTATLGPHMAQSHGCQFPNFGRRHVSQFAPPSAFGQPPRPREQLDVGATRSPTMDWDATATRFVKWTTNAAPNGPFEPFGYILGRTK